jgi:hypothetical protein
LINAGFSDAWSVTHPGEPGNTWAHAEDLLNDTVNLTQRLDLVLFRDGRSEDGFCAVGADIVGDELSDRTPSTTGTAVAVRSCWGRGDLESRVNAPGVAAKAHRGLSRS